MSRIVRASALRPTPWRNGRGVTRDVATHERTRDSFGWQISIADLTQDAEFSNYAGYDRIFTLIEGDGVELTLGDGPPLRCAPFVPTHFPGDRPTSCRLIGGPGRAFNLVLHRGVWTGRVSTLLLAAGHHAAIAPGAAAIHCATGEIMAGDESLGAGDTLLDPDLPAIRAAAAARVIAVEIAAASG